MSSTFKNTVAVLAIVTGLAGAAIAQTATDDTQPQPEATSPTPPATPAEPVEITVDTLPDALKALNLTDTDIDREHRHFEVEGRMADGTQIEAKLDRTGALRMIEADDDGVLPASVIEALVPEAVRGSDIFGQFSTIERIGLAPADAPMAGVMIKGEDAAGEDLRAAFAEDGTLHRFGRGDHDREMRGGKHGGRNGGEHGKHGGMRGGDMRGGDHGPRGGDRDGMRHGMDGGQPPAMLDEAAVTTILTDGGYTDLGAITQDGPRMVVEAVNAAGETVTVELNPRGEVVRETAR